MRKERRNILLPLILFLSGATAAVALQEPEKHGSTAAGELVRLTVEVTWGAAET